MKISIVTATYNSGATLRDTLNSVLAQDFEDFEHIVKDGGSTDNTLEILREYERKYNGRLKFISAPDKGIYDAMNQGIELTTGDVVGLLNSDDFYSSNDVLSTIDKEIRKFDAVYGDIHYVNPDNLDKCVRKYSSAGFRPWKMKLGFMPAHPSFYCRRTVYTRFGLFDTEFKVAADFEQLLRLIFVNKIFTHYVAKDFVTMRTGGASTSGLQSHKKILRDHLKAYKKNEVKSNIFYESLRYLYRIGELAKFRLGLH